MTIEDKKPSAGKNKWQQFDENQRREEQEQPTASSEFSDNPESEIENPEVTMETQAEITDSDLEAAQSKVSQLTEAILRVKADCENIRRRAERDVANAHKFGTERLISDLIPVLDSLTRGLDSADANNPALASVCQGMSLTADMFEKALKKHGVEVINPQPGDAFDPKQHEAMSMQKSPAAASNTILQVMQPGYKLNERVLKAAMVIVAA